MKDKYDVLLSLQLIHVCALKTTEMIKKLFMYINILWFMYINVHKCL